MIWGATKEEWNHFSVWLGLTEDLLPVVSNAEAKISPQSKMQALGKTPSRYNTRREVGGIPEWVSLKASIKQVEHWSKEPDYGICLQTRNIRALDIDIPDILEVEKILSELSESFPWVSLLPKRMRPNSGKVLLAFEMAGDFCKRVIKTNNGIIEFLANGQQFVAIGTHPSGAKYEWANRLPDSFPVVSAENFEKLWQKLTDMVAVSVNTSVARKKENHLDVVDNVLDKLEVLGWGKEGQAFITCPFEHEHSSDTGIASTAYFPAGTRGYQQGHFSCLHAHCADRTDEEFLDALGLRVSGFEVVEESPEEDIIPNFKRSKDGKIYALVDNIDKAIRSPFVCGRRIHLDTFRDEIMYAFHNTDRWKAWRDTDYMAVRLVLERKGFDVISKDTLRDCIIHAAEEQPRDSAQLWLATLRWDGIPRVETFLKDVFGTEDNEYTRAVSRYLWTALAGRVIVPGVKADMVPIIEGRQGLRKSTAVEAIAPAQEFFSKISFHEKDDVLSRKLRSCLVAEIEELSGLKNRELESLKAWIVKTHEHWVPKYRELAIKFPRRVVFIGTTNETEILCDPTGDRRWLPFHANKADVDMIITNRNQLWAEGAVMFEKKGIDWSAEKLSKEAHDMYASIDVWEEAVVNWLYTADAEGVNPIDKEYITMNDVLHYALGLDISKMRGADSKRAANIIRRLGYKPVVKRIGERTWRVWERDPLLKGK